MFTSQECCLSLRFLAELTKEERVFGFRFYPEQLKRGIEESLQGQYVMNVLGNGDVTFLIIVDQCNILILG